MISDLMKIQHFLFLWRLSKNSYKHFGIIKNIIWENLYFIEMDKKSKNKELFAKNYAIIAIILLKPNLFKAILKL